MADCRAQRLSRHLVFKITHKRCQVGRQVEPKAAERRNQAGKRAGGRHVEHQLLLSVRVEKEQPAAAQRCAFGLVALLQNLQPEARRRSAVM